MNSTLISILDSRFDLSDYVFHFTKGADAKTNLTAILRDKRIIDINNRGSLCFTEAPLPALVDMFEIFKKYKNPMYAPYGIAIPKDEFFALGGRPVIYGTLDDKKLLDQSIHWRFEPYSPSGHDFTWLREWRINLLHIDLDNSRHFVITATKMEELDHSFEEGDIVIDGCVDDGKFWPHYYLKYKRDWRSISIESLAKLSIKSRADLAQELQKQNPGDEAHLSLGVGS